jgi:hypothetical protein
LFFLAPAKKQEENGASLFAIDSANKSIRPWTPPSHVFAEVALMAAEEGVNYF